MEEFQWKVERLREIMEEKHISSVLITRNDNFSWITSGGRGWVVSGSDRAVAWVLVSEDSAYLVSNNIESRRLLSEEIRGDFELVEYKWYEDPFEKIEGILGSSPASDADIRGFLNVSDDMKKLRIVMSEWEIDRARKMGREMEEILEGVVENARSDMSELELAGEIRREFQLRGYDLPVLLVFSEKTRNLYRHNLPGDEALGRFFFVSICAKKHGLVLSMTRSAAFIRIFDDLETQHYLNAKIDARIMESTKPGKTLRDMFFTIRDIYSEYNHEDEFEKHHQGGIAGYNSREEKATPNSSTVLQPNMLVAWNPTITGTKSEDTILLTNDGFEILTFTRNSKWPRLDLGDIPTGRPGIKVL